MLVDLRLRRVGAAARCSVSIASASRPRLYSAQPSESVIDASSGRSALRLADHRLGGVEILAALELGIAEELSSSGWSGASFSAARAAPWLRASGRLARGCAAPSRCSVQRSARPAAVGERDRRAHRRRPPRRGAPCRPAHCRAAHNRCGPAPAPRRAALGQRQRLEHRASSASSSRASTSSASPASRSSAATAREQRQRVVGPRRRRRAAARAGSPPRCCRDRRGARPGPGAIGSALIVVAAEVDRQRQSAFRHSPRRACRSPCPAACRRDRASRGASASIVALRASPARGRRFAGGQRTVGKGQPQPRVRARPPCRQRVWRYGSGFVGACRARTASPRAARRRSAPAGCPAGSAASDAAPSALPRCGPLPRLTSGANKSTSVDGRALFEIASALAWPCRARSARRPAAAAHRSAARPAACACASDSASSACRPTAIAVRDRACGRWSRSAGSALGQRREQPRRRAPGRRLIVAARAST